jgi:hypothetical protein
MYNSQIRFNLTKLNIKCCFLLITCRFGFTIVPKKISIRKNEIAAPLTQTIVLKIQTVALFFLNSLLGGMSASLLK